MTGSQNAYARPKPTDIKLLGALLPKGYTEEVFETDTHYMCLCTHPSRSRMAEDGSSEIWDKFCSKLEAEFGDNLIEIYSITCYGAKFEVYLRKNKSSK